MATQAPTLSSPIASNSFAWLDRVATPLQQGLHGLFQSGTLGKSTKNWLNGVPIRHRLHPALVAVPLGAWTTGAILDFLDALSTEERYHAAADATIVLGIVSAVPTAAAGLADWADTYEHQRRVGMAHALINSTALALYGASLIVRIRKQRAVGRALSWIGLGVVSLGGALGGEMVFNLGVGVNYLLYPKPEDSFVDILGADELEEGKPRVVEHGRLPVLLLRREGKIHAVEGWCPHAGGPLIEGSFEGVTVTCPWHQSCFRLDDGRPLNGPAASSLRTFDVQERGGRLLIRPSDEGKGWPPAPAAPKT
jgi:nitrite reductase/ring-hydroxylating ferredoxin subunit/uncharacterized membrane protein